MFSYVYVYCCVANLRNKGTTIIIIIIIGLSETNALLLRNYVVTLEGNYDFFLTAFVLVLPLLIIGIHINDATRIVRGLQ